MLTHLKIVLSSVAFLIALSALHSEVSLRLGGSPAKAWDGLASSDGLLPDLRPSID